MRLRRVQHQGQSRPRLHAVRRGFTLVETIATIVVLAALGSAAAFIVVTAVGGYTGAVTQGQLHSELSMALDRIDRELRMVERESGGGVAPDLWWITADTIVWNGDSALYLSGDSLMFVDAGVWPPYTLLEDVSAFSVQAFNESNAAMAASLDDGECNSVRRLLVTITMQRDGVTETLQARVFLRCTMEGA